MADLRVGIVGAGLIARVHAGTFSATPGASVVAVADTVVEKAERLADRLAAKAVTNLDGVLDVGVDVVCICTPPRTHADLTVRALSAGMHVFCEKPVARSFDDAQKILAAAQTARGLVMVGHVSRFEPDHLHAKCLVDAGSIGQVRMMSHSITTALPGWSEGGWLADPGESGGPLVDLAVHSFDYLSWVLGSEPVRLHSVGADSAAGPTTYVLTTLRYANGAMGLVEASWAHPAARGTKLAVELVGTGGRLNWDLDHLIGGALHRNDGEVLWFDPLGTRGYAAEVGAFVEAIRSGAPSPVPVTAGLAALRSALAAAESIRTGETVDLTRWEPE